MLAVIEIGGNQFIVKVGDIIEVKKQDAECGASIDIAPLLVSDLDGNDTKIGKPLVSDAKVVCKVLEQKKGEKVRVFKMKSKKRFKRNRGFRPSITQLEIMSIS